MTDRPILFSAPMVRALLAGTKTQTRRVMSRQPSDDTTVHVERFHQTVVDRHGDEQPGPEVFGAWWNDGESGLKCPHGVPGDRLWVREAWRTAKAGEDRTAPRELCRAQTRIMFDASLSDVLPPFLGKGRPSIHMPRWASRITLNITGIRVERLQSISEADAVAEGIETMHEHDRDMRPTGRLNGLVRYPGEPAQWGRPREAFQALWSAINGAESWGSNPWVWVIDFERAEPAADPLQALHDNAQELGAKGAP